MFIHTLLMSTLKQCSMLKLLRVVFDVIIILIAVLCINPGR